MGRINRKLTKPSRSRQLEERANSCKRLAIGAADPKFAAKLQKLADEYEAEAARVKAQVEMLPTLRELAKPRIAHPAFSS